MAKETGKRLDVPFLHVWTLRCGRAVRFRQFLDTKGWVEVLRIASASTWVDPVKTR